MIEREILWNAKYVISYFGENGKEITNFSLGKLLYFLEAIYMVMTDDAYLFYEDFWARSFGPINEKVYNEYKFYGRIPIVLSEEVIIPLENKKYIVELYQLFKNFNASDLMNLSLEKSSPCSFIDTKYNSCIPFNTIVLKSETKKWFSSLVEKVK